jgi:hypothetical protein
LRLLRIKSAVEIGTHGFYNRSDASDQKGDTRPADKPSAEGLGKQPSRPLMGDLITVPSGSGAEDHGRGDPCKSK